MLQPGEITHESQLDVMLQHLRNRICNVPYRDRYNFNMRYVVARVEIKAFKCRA